MKRTNKTVDERVQATMAWEKELVKLAKRNKNIQFTIGDKIIEGENAGYITGGKYGRISNITGISTGQLQGYVSIARNVKSLLRNKNLTWNHHVAVAKKELKDDQKKKFLTLATNKKLSVRKLRKAIDEKFPSPDPTVKTALEQAIGAFQGFLLGMRRTKFKDETHRQKYLKQLAVHYAQLVAEIKTQITLAKKAAA